MSPRPRPGAACRQVPNPQAFTRAKELHAHPQRMEAPEPGRSPKTPGDRGFYLCQGESHSLAVIDLKIVYYPVASI